MADVLTSMSKMLADLQVAVCAVAGLLTFSRGAGAAGGCMGSLVGPVLASIPFVVRGVQCWVSYRDTGSTHHLVNLGKYASSFPVIWTSALKHQLAPVEGVALDKHDQHLQYLWLYTVTINSMVCAQPSLPTATHRLSCSCLLPLSHLDRSVCSFSLSNLLLWYHLGCLFDSSSRNHFFPQRSIPFSGTSSWTGASVVTLGPRTPCYVGRPGMSLRRFVALTVAMRTLVLVATTDWRADAHAVRIWGEAGFTRWSTTWLWWATSCCGCAGA